MICINYFCRISTSFLATNSSVRVARLTLKPTGILMNTWRVQNTKLQKKKPQESLKPTLFHPKIQMTTICAAYEIIPLCLVLIALYVKWNVPEKKLLMIIWLENSIRKSWRCCRHQNEIFVVRFAMLRQMIKVGLICILLERNIRRRYTKKNPSGQPICSQHYL